MTIANVSSTFITMAMITTYPIKADQGKLTPEFRELTKNS
jgi:hypothetical protein